MKLLFAANTPDSRSAGIAKIMNCLADSLRLKGHRVDLIFHISLPHWKWSRRVSDLSFPIALSNHIAHLTKSGERYDAVAIHSLSAAPYIFLRQFHQNLPPCVLVSYGADQMRWDLEKEEERLGFHSIRLFSKLFYPALVLAPVRYAVKHADKIMVAARSEIDFFEKFCGVAPAKVSFIPNGVAPEYFSQHDYARPAAKLLYLGGWEWRKGIRYLAQSFSLIAAAHPKVTLSLVGIGTSAEEAKKYFPADFHSRINVTPRVTVEETPKIYADHDIFLFPSLFESMSLVVPEAMASGLPVITTRTCGMPDIIHDGLNGYLVPIRDAQAVAQKTDTLLRNPDLRKTIGINAQASAKNILWDKIADQAAAMFQRILNRP